jgi:hypothetical protein
MTSSTAPDCQATPLSRENPGADIALSAPKPQQTVQYCGACSQSPCQGAERYSTCGFNWTTMTTKICDYYLGAICSQDGLMNCRCYSEDTP